MDGNEYYFNDEHPNGRDSRTNPKFWLGNAEYWDNLLKKISIDSNFVKKTQFGFLYYIFWNAITNKIINFFKTKI